MAGQDIRLLREVATSAWRPMTVLMLASVTNAAAMLALPTAIAFAADRQILGQGPAWALPALAAVLAIMVIADIIGQFASLTCTVAATRSLRHRLLRHTLALGLRGRYRFAAGDVVNRLIGNTSDAAAIGPTLIGLVTTTMMSIGGLVGLMMIDVRLALTFLAWLPTGWIVARTFVAQTTHLNAPYLALIGDISGRLVDALNGSRTIRVSGTVQRETDRILDALPELGAVGHGQWQAHGRASWQGGLFAAVAQVSVLLIAGLGVAAGRITPGQLLASIGYVTMAYGLMGQTGLMAALTRSRSAAARLAEILDEPVPQHGTAVLPPGPAELVLDAVTVQHDDRVVLDRLSLRVPPGRSVAIVGGSASGKSTLAAVAGGLLTPDDGQVRLAGVPLCGIDPAVLRREVTYAFENPALLGSAVADAIAFGADLASPDKVRQAAREAAADKFVRCLPNGYRTALSQAPMSGGERQRLGLARSFAHLGRLVILDDATSSLDTVTELRISQALARLLTGRTCLVIAHRPATVARCDLVAWLDNGRIRQLAPHHVLWRDAAYRAVFGSAVPATVLNIKEPQCAPQLAS